MRRWWPLSCLVPCMVAGCGPHEAPPPPPPAASTTAASTVGATAAPSLAATATPSSSATASPAPTARAAKAPYAPRLQRMVFGGDVAMTMHIGEWLQARADGKKVIERPAGFPLHAVGDRLRAADFAVVNLECVVSLKGTTKTTHNPFRCPDASIDVLQEAGVDLVSLANNHSLDFGEIGLRDTIKKLERKGLRHFGREEFSPKPQPVTIVELGGVKVGLLAHYWFPSKKALADVRLARPQVDVLIAFPHWGTEDQTEPMPLQRRFARKYIDAGVDLVVGTHAHVLQPTEVYKGKFIAYGLGNFVFNGMNDTRLHSQGAILEVGIGPDGVVAPTLYTIELDADGAPRFVVDPATEERAVRARDARATGR